MLEYQIIPVTPFQQNCSLVWCTDTMEAAIIDPGGELGKLAQIIADKGVKLTKVLLTHGHLDHVGAAKELSKLLDCELIGPHQADQFWLEQLPEQAKMFGLPSIESFTPDRWLSEGETITLGQQQLQVLHCPGHTPGHVVFFAAQPQLAFVGDVLFYRSIGRTDFPQGNHAELISSIKNKLFPLGDEVTFIPGHGPNSTFGNERLSNPFVR
ncbi:MBL fold metallo-hydrolase [Dongshaea marina]|uniref:MBL fold metallo-hydrolase n=1 Tax=Dongshaea marina TaxID=2047966 RepID=UPI000D3E12A0|nr:MBL fold metallo-hydrolase [Dongshaea marina]